MPVSVAKLDRLKPVRSCCVHSTAGGVASSSGVRVVIPGKISSWFHVRGAML